MKFCTAFKLGEVGVKQRGVHQLSDTNGVISDQNRKHHIHVCSGCLAVLPSRTDMSLALITARAYPQVIFKDGVEDSSLSIDPHMRCNITGDFNLTSYVDATHG